MSPGSTTLAKPTPRGDNLETLVPEEGSFPGFTGASFLACLKGIVRMQTSSNGIAERLFAEMHRWELVDSHSHIQPLSATSQTLTDVLGYHYFTEQIHSAGLAREAIEDPQLSARDKFLLLAAWLPRIDNTAAVAWLVELSRELFGFTESSIHADNAAALYDLAQTKLSAPDWEQQVLRASHLKAVFLTNEFDDPLTGFDRQVYIPCLRTDDLVFQYALPKTRERLAHTTGVQVTSLVSLRNALGNLFERFQRMGAKACAISLPPTFAPLPPDELVLDRLLQRADQAELESDEREILSLGLFWELAKQCEAFGLPFDLMIGVHRKVYPQGVYQGQDLYDSRVSLHAYAPLFNAFPSVKFPVSVLASVTNQELVSYAWIFPNVYAHGHWWYSNTPSMVERDLAHRLEAMPRNKILGYYSDMYKLEFALPKFRMYQRLLARLLATQFVQDRGWTEDRALAFGKQILRDNVLDVFGV